MMPSRSVSAALVRRSLTLAAGAITLTAALSAQAQVRDLQPGTGVARGGTPSHIVDRGGVLFFQARDAYGIELWRSDGTAAGTRLVRDIAAGESSSTPNLLTAANGFVFFTANQPGLGIELWRTNGSAAGTILLADAQPGASSSGISDLIRFNNRLYYAGSEPGFGIELRVSDGTVAGTRVAVDVRPGSIGSSPRDLVIMGGSLWFTAADGFSGSRALFRSDGTPSGTSRVLDGSTGTNDIQDLVVSGNRIYFLARDPAFGRELFVTDGTAAGTRRLTDVAPGAANSTIEDLCGSAGRAYFVADEAATGAEPWTSDGTPGGTRRLADIRSGTADAGIRHMASMDGRVLFDANDGSAGREPYVSDGTVAGTRRVLDLFSGSRGSDPTELTVVPGVGFVFAASDASNGRELWRVSSDGSGLARLADINPGLGSSNPGEILVRPGGDLAFAATDPRDGRGLYVANRATAGATINSVADFWFNQGDSRPRAFHDLGGRAIFVASDGARGAEWWTSNGSSNGTQLVTDLVPGGADGAIGETVRFRDSIWFSANARGVGRELFRTDGTASGTLLGADVRSGPLGSSPEDLFEFEGRLLLFTADANGAGREPWAINGTGGAAFLLGDLSPGSTASFPREFTAVDGAVVFSAAGPNGDREVWVTDGSPAGTRLLLDIAPGSASSNPTDFVARDGLAFFVASDGSSAGGSGRELWRTDGTVAGTHRVADLQTGGGSSSPQNLAVTEDLLFFTASRSGLGRELHVSDGTTAGTQLVQNTTPGSSSTQFQDFVGVSDKMFFFADDGVHGFEPWVSDGTAAGTTMLGDLLPGPASSVQAGSLARLGVDDRVFFAAAGSGGGGGGGGGLDGLQIWTSDGTAAGTRQVGRIGTQAGVGAATLQDFVTVGDQVFFAADDNASGLEPWRFSPLAQGLAVARVYGSGCVGSNGQEPRNRAVGLPRFGNSTFASRMTRARSGAVCALDFSFAPSDLALGGCRVLIAAPLRATIGQITDGSGAAQVPLPIPNDPSASGAQVYLQWVVLDPGGSLFGAATLSDGLQVVLGR